MISTTSGSSSAVAISGPIAVRSIWMRRSSEVAADERGSGGICGTALMRHALRCQRRRVIHPHRLGIQFFHHIAHQAAPTQQVPAQLFDELLEARLPWARAAS